MSTRAAAALAFLVTVLAAALAVPATPASAAASGVWRNSCGYVGSTADDPIALPGRPGAAHLHDFFGNSSTRASSTYASMRGMASSCPQQDRAAYWTPALYRNGRKVVQAGLTATYLTAVSPGDHRIEPFPPDFRMSTGDAGNVDPAAVGEQIRWGCLDGTRIGRAVPQTCLSGGIQVRITFPSCWNGRSSVDDAAPDLRFPSRGRCPAGFDRALPVLRIDVAYPTGADVGAVTLASGPVPTIHAAFWNTWEQSRLAALVDTCLRAARQCPHFSGVTAGAVPRTRLGTGPPLAPTGIPDAGSDTPDTGDSTDPDAGEPGAGDDPVTDAGDPDAGTPGSADGGGADGGDLGDPASDASDASGGQVVDGETVDGPVPSVAPDPAAGSTGRGRVGGAEPASQRTAVDTPTIGAPPWTHRRTQVGDVQQSDRANTGKQQTWTFAAEQAAPAWLGLAAAGVAVLCLIGGGLWLAQRRRTPSPGSR